ncbi:MAG: pyridoxamine 5'-phosphate oxidase [Gammaproteobacteria bacterium]|jgi:pyridoxamine 5'-phosphate oxidase|nr:pyridoxamine 5'-phosphate oxidase [Gammaproteobacteria bacterium]
MDLHDMRREYLMGELRRKDLHDDPHEQFALWMKQAFDMEVVDPPAMVIATVDAAGVPSQRIVLLKHFDSQGFIFYTSYLSHKGSDLDGNPNISLHFPWHAVERQIRITGTAERLSREESQRYFHSRPRGSQLAAAVSPQSSVVDSREALETAFAELDAQTADSEVPFPETWGGYRVQASQMEFWQGGANRLHNRFRYTHTQNAWQIDRLAP